MRRKVTFLTILGESDPGVPFEIVLTAASAKVTRSGDWIVEGFAATSDLDLQGDIILPEALEKAAEGAIGLTVLHNHDPDQEVGTVLDARAELGRDGTGRLWVKLRIDQTEEKLWKKVLSGTINKFSIRGKVLKAHRKFDKENKQQVTIIEALLLMEISLVAVPANQNALAVDAYVAKTVGSGFESGGAGGTVEPASLLMVVTKALVGFEKSGGTIPTVESGSADATESGDANATGSTGDERMDLWTLWLEFCKGKGFDPVLVETVDDMEKAIKDAGEKAESLWEEFCEKQKYPYPYPYPYPKPDARKPENSDAERAKKLVGELKDMLKENEAAMKLLEELGKLVAKAKQEPTKDEGSKELGELLGGLVEKLDAAISKAPADGDLKEALSEIRQLLEQAVAKVKGSSEDASGGDPAAGAASEGDPDANKGDDMSLADLTKSLKALEGKLEETAGTVASLDCLNMGIGKSGDQGGDPAAGAAGEGEPAAQILPPEGGDDAAAALDAAPACPAAAGAAGNADAGGDAGAGEGDAGAGEGTSSAGEGGAPTGEDEVDDEEAKKAIQKLLVDEVAKATEGVLAALKAKGQVRLVGRH